MPFQLASPLNGLRHADDLLSLSYFDTLACLGDCSLHCGGIRNTAELLYLAQAHVGQRVLEVGCGTGATTVALLRTGYEVVAVEPSARMLAAMVRNCLMQAGRVPEHHLASAADLRCLQEGRFDVVLLECVFGFIPEPAAALAEILRVLKPGGAIAVTDFHYVSEPPSDLVEQLARDFGIQHVLRRADWERCFGALQLQAWQDVPMGAGGITPRAVDGLLVQAGLFDAFPGGVRGRTVLTERLSAWDRVFARNRHHMAGHNAVWRKPDTAA